MKQVSLSEMQSKPKWALTETQNEIAMEKEVDELLDFVDSLQIDYFFENLEMQQKLEAIKDRIERIQKDANGLNRTKRRLENEEIAKNTNDYAKTLESSVEDKQDMPMFKMNVVNPKSNVINKKREDKLTKSQIAHQILSTSENIRNVHSKQSIVSILKNSKKEFVKFRMNDDEETKSEEEYIETGTNEHNEPTVHTVCERLPPLKVRGKLNAHDVNNLPYLYRHPGV